MASQRKALLVNANNSKNTRMDIADAGLTADWRPDILAHISRYCKIVEHIMKESKRLERPIDCFELGAGQLWALRYLYKAIVCKKSEQIRQYVGYDIDPSVLTDLYSDRQVNDSPLMKLINGELKIKDVTVDPTFDSSSAKDGLFDFFWSTEVIEHMKPEFVEPWIKNVKQRLRAGGLLYISTPNHDGSNEKLPKDHVYEWGFEELRTLLTKHFKLIRVDGIFTQMNNFKRGYKEDSSDRKPSTELIELISERFDPHWQRVVLGMFYPEKANNCAWTLRKE